MTRWKVETRVPGIDVTTITTIVSSLRAAYLAISTMDGVRYSHIITRMS